ncbi:helix-turn-helix domain-containing protein [Nocardia sp. CDC159]|uniref:Helix-turn-helix domain-containing protein n=1 Tax=Nocardia pulmonis TaxID=2951408 RepID=A0A9X2E7N2_9NOCA|nr:MULTISPECIES: helix-turn-helix transcriptional regulator [Nocardia]MCM6775622.1 helix-turn-helix domain-containing protein [Nocardia pulmonis]MCM6787644.1 helix-turn-helix domain-containing protein [Nocardia sp. CDC159]
MADPTLASRRFGRKLQRFRERAGMSEYAVAKAVEMSPQTYGRLEDGVKQNVSSLLVNGLCDKLGVSDEERQQLLDLAEEVRQERNSEGRSWRAFANRLRPSKDRYFDLEESARKITTVEFNLVPGLLQTMEYRRQLAWAEFPNQKSEEVEGLLTFFQQRRRRLEDPEFEFEALISEAALRHPTGGPGVMGDQLRYLTELDDRPNVSIRVLPFSTNPFAAVVGSFVWLDFPMLTNSKLTSPPVVFVEGYVGALYLTAEDQIGMYREALRNIRRVALGADATRDLILSIAREYAP